MDMKICHVCKKELPATSEYFNKYKRARDGFRYECKECHREASRKHYFDNHEKYLDKHQEWRSNNKENIRVYHKHYNKVNKEIRNAYGRQYYANNKEIYIIKDQRRRALIANLPNDFTKEDWKNVLNLFNYECAYCGSTEDITQDHIIPVKKGGGYTVNNIIPACRTCNCSKQDTDMEEWFRYQDSFTKERLSNIKAIQNMVASDKPITEPTE